MSNVGHNSSYVERIARLMDEIDGLRDAIKDVKTEAKAKGDDPKALALAVKQYREDPEKAAERERIQREADLMLAAIGPLGAAAVRGLA